MVRGEHTIGNREKIYTQNVMMYGCYMLGEKREREEKKLKTKPRAKSTTKTEK